MTLRSIKKQSAKNGKLISQNNLQLNNNLIINRYLRKFESENGLGEFYRDADGNWRIKKIKKTRMKSKSQRATL